MVTPVPVSPLTMDPTPGMKNEISSDTAGFFGAIAAVGAGYYGYWDTGGGGGA